MAKNEYVIQPGFRRVSQDGKKVEVAGQVVSLSEDEARQAPPGMYVARDVLQDDARRARAQAELDQRIAEAEAKAAENLPSMDDPVAAAEAKK